MEDDLESKTLQELKQVQQQLNREIDVMSEMRARQIESALNAAGEAAKDLTSERHIDIRATINSRFQALLDDLYNRLAACERRIDWLTQNQNGT
jgi:acyl-CoA reductase-like NAD-dependent aldehyde dehydrogenase